MDRYSSKRLAKRDTGEPDVNVVCPALATRTCGLDHGEYASLDGLGKIGPGGHDPFQIRLENTTARCAGFCAVEKLGLP